MTGPTSPPGGSFFTEISTGLSNLMGWIGSVGSPSLRIGVTGLSRSGKTVFMTGLVHALVSGARLPALKARAEGRISAARLVPHPDDALPRFAYDEHIARLLGPDRQWPHSTRSISGLSLEIAYESKRSSFGGLLGPGGVVGSAAQSLRLDLVDYPGEWLLDLPLLMMSYAEWSAQTLNRVGKTRRRAHFDALFDAFAQTHADDEAAAKSFAQDFTDGLRAARAEGKGQIAMPPGRFLMPGDLEGAPLLAFAPLPADRLESSLGMLMARRFEAYKAKVVQPFYRDHIATLDRQIVLVDVLSAIHGGKEGLEELEAALADVLLSFNVGAQSLLSAIFRPRISRILFAATKADHLPARNHARIEAVLRMLVRRAYHRAEGAGAVTECVALAAIRATREAEVTEGGALIPCVAGVPQAGEVLDTVTFDGAREAVYFPGDLPERPDAVFAGEAPRLRFLTFRPPLAEGAGRATLPSLRLDRALEFLIGEDLT